MLCDRNLQKIKKIDLTYCIGNICIEQSCYFGLTNMLKARRREWEKHLINPSVSTKYSRFRDGLKRTLPVIPLMATFFVFGYVLVIIYLSTMLGSFSRIAHKVFLVPHYRLQCFRIKNKKEDAV